MEWDKELDYAWYSSIETLGAVDGPGLRLIYFLQGCPLRCLFCHNPETIPYKQENRVTVDEVIAKYRSNESFYQANGGGITISGGEAMGQIDFLLNLAVRCREEEIHLTIDTAAGPFMGRNYEKVIALSKLINLYLIDIKNTNEEASIELTGYGTENQYELIKLCERLGTKFWVRHVLVPTFSDRTEEIARDLGRVIGNLKHMERFEILPYHDMMIPKYESMGLEFKLGHINPPTKEETALFKGLVKEGIQDVRKHPEKNPLYYETN